MKAAERAKVHRVIGNGWTSWRWSCRVTDAEGGEVIFFGRPRSSKTAAAIDILEMVGPHIDPERGIVIEDGKDWNS
jgi:hypothetical protein